MNAILLQCAGATTILKCGCDTTMATNWQDFAQSAAIAIPICAVIAFIAWVAKGAVLSWKAKEVEANENEREFKKQKEKEESERKQKSNLLEKYLDFLKEQASKDDKLILDHIDVLAGFKESLKKGEDNRNVEIDYTKIVNILKDQMDFLKKNGFKSNVVAEGEYKRVLVYLIQLSQQGKLNDFSIEDLNKSFK